MSIGGLFAQTARLPMVDFREPVTVDRNQHRRQRSSPGCTTVSPGMIDGILERVFEELGDGCKAIATGGQGHMIARSARGS